MNYCRHYLFGAALLLLSAACTPTGDTTGWKTDAISQLHRGNFTTVDSILNSLDEAAQQQFCIEIDSIRQIISRIESDFGITPEDGRRRVRELVPGVTDSQIDEWIGKRYIETMDINGEQRWFNKSVRNLRLIDVADFAEYNRANKDEGFRIYSAYYDKLMASAADDDNVRNWHSAQITFTLDVDANAVPDGEVVRVWLPYPFENGRQRNIKLIASSHDPQFSEGSVHHTVYMEDKAVKDRETHFEITLAYEVGGQYFDAETINANLRPYDKECDIYKKYTSTEYPHIVISDKMRELAMSIVGDETNPVTCAGMIYDWIVARYPWAGARDYSTIPNIPEYVIAEGHGDCGQVSLLNITLLRSLGIPARWESGWMLHPDEKNLHDWGEIYFEGTGWVPCDVSFGRMSRGTRIKDYYKTGTDIYRFATNEGVNGELSPKKKYIRCETVDFQLGEAEWAGGNLPMGKWSSKLIIDKFEPVQAN